MPEHLSKKLISWASILEPNTREQAISTASMPFVYPHLALMPDAHLGKGAAVGSVIPTLRAIIPAAVGMDIGCGMTAVRTQWNAEQMRAAGPLSRLREAIEARIPLSAGVYNTTETRTAGHAADELADEAARIDLHPDHFVADWRLQLGSLGSGNHFIEVSSDETGTVWLFLHSGSRGIGNKIAGHHIAVARKLAERWWLDLPGPDLAYLVQDTDEFWRYVRDLRWAQSFALANREEMMDRVIVAISEHMSEQVQPAETINCHHNFTEHEHHFGKNMWVSRKGAIRAGDGEPGLIPGSMGTASYVVVGRGNPFSLCSAPHGAGRNHSRSAARKKFTHDDLETAMTGIEYRHTDAFIDELPAAYKPIDQVMADSADLVQIRHTLRQLVNVKGD
ncbi:MAG: RtcB family protein [Micrococcales bacterium]|nr:RtcB family protein [Micrococcales bacterium]